MSQCLAWAGVIMMLGSFWMALPVKGHYTNPIIIIIIISKLRFAIASCCQIIACRYVADICILVSLSCFRFPKYRWRQRLRETTDYNRHGIMGQAGQAPPCMGMLAASWTKVGWSSPDRNVTVKRSAGKYLRVLLEMKMHGFMRPSSLFQILGCGGATQIYSSAAYILPNGILFCFIWLLPQLSSDAFYKYLLSNISCYPGSRKSN